MCNRTEQRNRTLEYFSFWVNFYDSQLWFILYESYGRKCLELVPWNFKLGGVFGDSWIDEKIKTFNNFFSYKQIIFIIVTHINQMFSFINSCFSIVRRKLKIINYGQARDGNTLVLKALVSALVPQCPKSQCRHWK